jgi:mono/diheme cytochrome c family protein
MMTRILLPLAVIVATAFALPSGKAETGLQLKSVRVELPTDERMFPQGPGSDIANNNCLACHSAGMVLDQPAQPRAVWQAEVDKMREAYKAPIDSSDVDAIVNYLVSIKGKS